MNPYLAPIERPRGLLMRLAFALSRRQFGKVLSALKVIYARKPGLALLAQRIAAMQAKLSIEPELRFLVQVMAARQNGCRFCEDVQLAMAYRRHMGPERFAALADFRTSPLFNERERAALALAEEATTQRQLKEATWAQLKRHFSETQIVELVWLNASENYFNLQAAVLGLSSDGLSQSRSGQHPDAWATKPT